MWSSFGADGGCMFVSTVRLVREARVGARHGGADVHDVAAQASAGQVRAGLSASGSGGEGKKLHVLQHLLVYPSIQSLSLHETWHYFVRASGKEAVNGFIVQQNMEKGEMT